MSKYIDLAEQIHAETRDQVYLDEVGEVLSWLDRNPDQAPGRTITESDYSDITEWARNFFSRGWEGRTVLAEKGITIVPDPVPEPTNLQRLSRAIRDWEEGRGEDRILARHLDALGVRVATSDR